MLNLGRLSVVLVACLVGSFGQAQEVSEPVVRGQLYNVGSRFEVNLTPAMSVFDKYTRHVATSLGISYFFNDYFGVQAEGGYSFISGDRKLLTEILERGAESLDQIAKLPLSDLKHLTWFANAGLILNPLYGKLEFSSEFAISFHLYLIAGAGVGDYKYTELAWSNKVYEKNIVDAGVKPNFYFGGGVQLHLGPGWSLRLEMRDVFFYDDYKAQYKPAGTTVKDKEIKDFVHINMLRLGVCYAF